METNKDIPRVLLPPTYHDLGDAPLIFLAGPITGAEDWQATAAALLGRLAPGVRIANPRRPVSMDADFGEYEYNEQVDWEHRHLEHAAERGVLLFWLAKEAKHRCDRAYAQTTRFELGEAMTVHRLRGAKLVVGLEEGFSNSRYLLRTVAKKAPDVPLLSTLEATCEAAARLVG